MLAKPRTISVTGIIQVLLASAFVIWLLFFPSTGGKFAWPIKSPFSAMFIGAGFIPRAFIGYFLWREKDWPKLRWQVAANYAFLLVIFLATYWHIAEMNWKSNLLVAHIWIIAYTAEPIILFLIEPRTAQAKAPLPEELRRGPVSPGLKIVVTLGLLLCVTLGGMAIISPQFMDTRWPWALDPFDARIMAAFFALNALWCVTIYLAEDWAEVRMAALGMTLYALSNFVVWLVILPQLDTSRNNVYSYGIGFGLFTILLGYFFWKQEKTRRLTTPG
jgi:hypothetical protein